MGGRGAWPQRRRPDEGRGRRTFKQAAAALRVQVEADPRAHPCYFYGRPGFERCPGLIDLDLHPQERWAFTAHHLERLMDGGQADTDRLVQAHRACNAADGLRAQNARRRVGGNANRVTRDLVQDETSRAW